MGLQEIKGKEIEQLQQQHRKRIVRCMFWFELSFFLIDFAFFLYYYITGDNVNEVTPQNYLPRWVIFPAVVNTVFLLLAYKSNHNPGFSDKKKNRIVSIMFVSQVGCMSICHAFFTEIWLGPCIVTLMSIVFMDEKLEIGLLWYNYILAISSAINI